MASAVASPSLLYAPNNSNNYSGAPKSGILLNPYPPARSPRMNQAQSLPLPSSECPAIRRSAPNTPYIAVNGANVPLPRAESPSSSNSGGDGQNPDGAQGGGHSRTNSMRIRFAPLPDIRKMEEAEYLDSPLAATHLALSATDDTQLPSPTTPGSQYSHMSVNSTGSGSTTGAGGALVSATFFSNTTGDATETGSDQGGVMSSLSSATKQKSKNWTKRIFKPLLKSQVLASSASQGHDQSDDGLWRTNSRDSFTSATSNEGGSHSLSRRMTTEYSGNGAFGAPLTRVQSAGTAPGRTRKNTKMLNGRVYGSKSTAAAFQNIRDDEPAFVEWGHGGAGSVRNHSGGAESSKYAGVQSGAKVSIGAVSGHPGEMGGDDYDDGSGVAWLRKRKLQRERERVEKEAKALEDAKTATTTHMDDTKASASIADPKSHQLTTITAASGAPTPDDATEGQEDGIQAQPRALPERSSSQLIETVSISPRQGFPNLISGNNSTVVSPSASGTHTPAAGEEHHVVKAIKVPAPPHAHAHGHVHGHVHEGSNDAKEEVTMPLTGEPAEIETGAPSTSSKSSTDSDSEEEEDDDDDEREEEESETDEEDNAQNEQRKTSVCAGVEKVSRHKELEQQSHTPNR